MRVEHPQTPRVCALGDLKDRFDRVMAKIEHVGTGMLEAYVDAMDDLRQRAYVASVLQAVSSLPVHKLADIAESLANLTSSKRRASMEVESVGGPIDVAVITAVDGFI